MLLSTLLSVAFLALSAQAGSDEPVDHTGQDSDTIQIYYHNFEGPHNYGHSYDNSHASALLKTEDEGESHFNESGHHHPTETLKLATRNGKWTNEVIANDYATTPVPGIYFCNDVNLQGKCEWYPIVANPVICQQVPQEYTGAEKAVSIGLDRDLQCAIHSDLNCRGAHTAGRFTWPGVGNFKAGYFGSGGPFLAYRCRRCPGCNERNLPRWDGVEATKVPQAADVGLGMQENGV